MNASGPATTRRADENDPSARWRRPTRVTAGSNTSPKATPREGRWTTVPSVKTAASLA